MVALPADAPLRYDEYLHFEESVDSRHEFIEGDILAMAGGTRRHAVLKSRLSARLTIALGEGGPCSVEDSDTRIVVERGARLNAYYPDMVVICGVAQTHANDRDGGVVNPTLLAEVTSPNTEKRDRGIKLEDYRSLASLREYLVVSHVRHEVEIWSRANAESEWTRRVVTAGQASELTIGATLVVDDLFRDPLPPR
jgi:Uma2 family endonuclease